MLPDAVFFLVTALMAAADTEICARRCDTDTVAFLACQGLDILTPHLRITGRQIAGQTPVVQCDRAVVSHDVLRRFDLVEDAVIRAVVIAGRTRLHKRVHILRSLAVLRCVRGQGPAGDLRHQGRAVRRVMPGRVKVGLDLLGQGPVGRMAAAGIGRVRRLVDCLEGIDGLGARQGVRRGTQMIGQAQRELRDR